MVATRSSFTAIATLLLGAISPAAALVDGIDATPYTFEYAVSVQRTSGLGASPFTSQDGTIIQKGVDQKRCVSTWADTAPITDSICAEAIPKIGILAGQPKASTCFLDNGSPLVDLLGGTLVGVVSNFNRDCTSEPKPNVYTDVHANADWIHANTV